MNYILTYQRKGFPFVQELDFSSISTDIEEVTDQGIVLLKSLLASINIPFQAVSVYGVSVSYEVD